MKFSSSQEKAQVWNKWRYKYKKLSYCRGTVRHAMLINSCYVSRGMGVKGSNCRHGLQGHWRALATVPF